MLEIKDILMGAQTDSPALDDLCRLVADRLPYRDITASDMAQIVMFAGHGVKTGDDGHAADYPHLCKYLENGGDMCKLLAKVSSVLEKGAKNSEVEPYAQAYKVESILFFGPAD